MPDAVSLSWMAIEEYVPRRLRTSCGDADAVRFVRLDVRPELDDRHVVLTDATAKVLRLDLEIDVELNGLPDVVFVT
jgi:hypothetical protein